MNFPLPELDANGTGISPFLASVVLAIVAVAFTALG